MAEQRVRVGAAVGLHARPAALFVQAVHRTGLAVTIAKPDGVPVDARSILAVLSLDVRHGDEVVLRIDPGTEGSAADEALAGLAELLAASEPSPPAA